MFKKETLYDSNIFLVQWILQDKAINDTERICPIHKSKL